MLLGKAAYFDFQFISFGTLYVGRHMKENITRRKEKKKPVSSIHFSKGVRTCQHPRFWSCRQTSLWHAEEEVKRLTQETCHLGNKRFDISLREWEALEMAKTSLEAEMKQLVASLQEKEKVIFCC